MDGMFSGNVMMKGKPKSGAGVALQNARKRMKKKPMGGMGGMGGKFGTSVPPGQLGAMNG